MHLLPDLVLQRPDNDRSKPQEVKPATNRCTENDQSNKAPQRNHQIACGIGDQKGMVAAPAIIGGGKKVHQEMNTNLHQEMDAKVHQELAP